MRIKRCHTAAIGGAILALMAGCVIDTVPLPEMGEVNTQAMFYADAGDGVLLAGIEHAVPAEGTVMVSRPGVNRVDTLPATAQGSFAGVIQAAIGDEVEVSFLRDGIVWSSAPLLLRPGTADAHRAGSDLDAELEQAFDDAAAGGPSPPAVLAERSAGGDSVEVFGQLAAFNPGLTIVAANVTRGVATETTPTADGSFSLSIPAASGDVILVFTTEPGASNGGSTPTELIVP